MAKSAPAALILPTPYTVESLFDSRVVERHIAEGRTTEAAFQAHLDALPDEAAEQVESELRFVVRGRTLATVGSDDDEG